MDPKQIDNSQATPPELVTPAGVEVPEFAPDEVQTQTEPQTEAPLTLETVRKLIQTEAGRIAQRQVSLGESRIQKQIQEKFDALEKTKSALKLSDDQVKQARQEIVTEAYSSPEEPPTDQKPPAAAESEDPVQFMNAQLKIVFDTVGQAVTKSDPEFQELQQTINRAWTDPNGLTTILLAGQRLAAAKATRLQKNQQTAAGRVVGGGQSTSGQVQAGNAHDAWENAYKK